MNLFKWLTAPLWLHERLWLLAWFLLRFSARGKASTPGHSLWLLTATCWEWREQLYESEPLLGVRWLNHHGDRRGSPIHSLHGDEILYFPGGQDQELWPPTLLLIDLLLTIQNAEGSDYPTNKAKSESSVDLSGTFEISAVLSHWRRWRSIKIVDRAENLT